jgi:hypothetical protein
MGITRQVSRLPLTAFSLGLEAWERSAGLRQFALRRGGEALQIAAHTPLGRLLPKLVLDDGADEEAARIAAAARAEAPAAPAAPQATETASGDNQSPKTPATKDRRSSAATPARQPTPAPEQKPASAVTPEVEQIVEKVVDQLEIDEPETRDELPIPDFDNITLGSLRARLRNLGVEQLVALREWEQAHAHRLPVLTALDNRIAKLSAEAYPETPESTTPAHPA